MDDKDVIDLIENDALLAPYKEYLLNNFSKLSTLEETNKTLENDKKDLESQNKDLQLKLTALEETLNNRNKTIFGKKSERVINPNQLSLFNEVEEVQVELKKPDNVKKEKKQVKKLHQQLADNVTSEQVHIIDNKDCPNCEGQLHELKYTITNELVYHPEKYEVVSHKVFHYACRNCANQHESTPVIKAAAPTGPIYKSCASASLIASIAYKKYVLHLPLERIAKDIKTTTNFDISKQTLSNWLTKTNDSYFNKIVTALQAEIANISVIHADETPIRVLNDAKMSNKSGKGYMWVYTSGKAEVPFTLYDYQPSRAGVHAANYLANFNGYLHCDGYSGYNNINEVTRIGCFAHVRRKFISALEQVPPEQQQDNIAKLGIDFCNAVFSISGASETETIKQQQMSELLKVFKSWLDEVSLKCRPKLQFSEAVKYALNQWEYLSNVLLDINLEVSNNRAERAVKPFVIGRKNWLFSNTARGAKTSANIYSIVETAKQNNLNVLKYLEHVIFTMSQEGYEDSQITKLLPYSKELPDLLI